MIIMHNIIIQLLLCDEVIRTGGNVFHAAGVCRRQVQKFTEMFKKYLKIFKSIIPYLDSQWKLYPD